MEEKEYIYREREREWKHGNKDTTQQDTIKVQHKIYIKIANREKILKFYKIYIFLI